MSRRALDVAFTIDANYLPHWAVALWSLLQNNARMRIRPHLVFDGIEAAALQPYLDFFAAHFGTEVRTYRLDSSVMDRFKISHHVNKATYFRLCLGELLPSSIDRLLFLDSDLVVPGSLAPLADLDFDETCVLYAVDHRFDVDAKAHFEPLGLARDAAYFNAGVLLLDLKRWRDEAWTPALLAIAEARKAQILWWDQDVLNLFLHDRWRALHPRYNVIWEILESDPDILQIREAQQSPSIVHYTRSVKPWHENSWHPHRDLYRRYRAELNTAMEAHQ